MQCVDDVSEHASVCVDDVSEHASVWIVCG